MTSKVRVYRRVRVAQCCTQIIKVWYGTNEAAQQGTTEAAHQGTPEASYSLKSSASECTRVPTLVVLAVRCCAQCLGKVTRTYPAEAT